MTKQLLASHSRPPGRQGERFGWPHSSVTVVTVLLLCCLLPVSLCRCVVVPTMRSYPSRST